MDFQQRLAAGDLHGLDRRHGHRRNRGFAFDHGRCDGLQPRLRRLALGQRIQQRAGVNVLRVADHRLGWSFLDDLAFVHDVNAVAELCDHGEIVGDQQHGGVGGRGAFFQEAQDLRLHRNVQRRGGLVGDDQLRAAGERHRDHHPLAHAAGEFVRISVEGALRVRNLHVSEQIDAEFARFFLGNLLMAQDHVEHLFAHAQDRVQGGHRLLENHRHFAAAHPLQFHVAHLEDVAVEDVDAGCRRNARFSARQKPQQAHGGDGLAGAGLADQADDLAGGDVQRNPAQGFDHRVLAEESQRQIFNADDWTVGGGIHDRITRRCCGRGGAQARRSRRRQGSLSPR